MPGKIAALLNPDLLREWLPTGYDVAVGHEAPTRIGTTCLVADRDFSTWVARHP